MLLCHLDISFHSPPHYPLQPDLSPESLIQPPSTKHPEVYDFMALGAGLLWEALAHWVMVATLIPILELSLIFGLTSL